MNNRIRFVATPESLSIAEQLAERLDIPFNKQQTNALAYDLLDQYFADIATVLQDETRDFDFRNFALRNFSAFADRDSDGQPIIEMDQQWTFLLMDANFLVCIQACYTLAPQESKDLQRLFQECLQTMASPSEHEVMREKMKPLIFTFAKALPVANLITRTMFGFMICHEIAHHSLRHLDKPQAIQDELDADALGYQYLNAVSAHFETLSYFTVPPNFLFAPLLMMHYLQAVEDVFFGGLIPASHPSAADRLRALTEHFNQVTNQEAHRLYHGFKAGFDDIIGAV